MAISYSNFTVILCFLVIFVIIIIKITIIIVIIIMQPLLSASNFFPVMRAKRRFDVEKEDQVAGIGVGGGGFRWKKTFFSVDVFPKLSMGLKDTSAFKMDKNIPFNNHKLNLLAASWLPHCNWNHVGIRIRLTCTFTRPSFSLQLVTTCDNSRGKNLHCFYWTATRKFILQVPWHE